MINLNDETVKNELSNIKIAAIGGGTGISTMLRGIKHYTENITAIITVADDGGGSGMLREDLNMLAPGDVRNCLLALSNTEPILDKVWRYRFPSGRLKGQSFGNLFLAAMYGVNGGNFEDAVRQCSDVLAVKGRVLPVTNQNVNLGAKMSDGSTVLGESTIPTYAYNNHCSIERIFLTPSKVSPVEDCIKSIEDADLIILGPGSLYTSIIPNLLVEGVTDAIKRSKAKVVYVANIMTQKGETEGYTAFDHAKAIIDHSYEDIIDYCIINDEEIDDFLKSKYRFERAVQVKNDADKFIKHGIELICENMLDSSKGYARHNYDKLASAIMNLCYKIKK